LLVVVAIIAILAGMLIPVLARARDKGRAAVCQSNLRQLLIAATLYDQEHNSYPIGWDNNAGSQTPPGLWYYQLQPYLGRSAKTAGGGVFVCPSSLQKGAVGQAIRAGGVWGFLAYAQNGVINNGTTGIGSRSVRDASGTLLYADTDGWDACLYPDRDPKDNPSDGNVCYRHSGGSEKSTETARNEVRDAQNQKAKITGRANVAFIDSHVELRRKTPKALFTLEID
jgi:prepilin-type processing-associated H-X9-DG protein